jgi:flagellar hook-associated protein 2
MSSTTQLTGLASGLDWRTLVDKLISAERAPENRLKAQQSRYEQQTNALDNFKTKLTDLQTSIKSLTSSDSVYEARSASIASATSSWTASAAAGAETGTYQIDVTQLATKTQRVGASDVGGALSATSDVSGLTIGTLGIATAITAGEFTVNGARITVAGTDSLQDVFNQISTKTGGAVTASYDPLADKVQLTSGSEIVLGSANDSSNFLSAMQLFNNGTGTVLAPKALGVVSVSAAIKNANLKQPITGVDGSGAGSFQINGVNIDFNINTDSIQAIVAKINGSSAGVSASFDKSNDRFVLTNKTTGDVGLAVTEGAGGLLEALGVNSTSTLARGNNAQFTIDGGPTLTSTSNTLDATSTGITGLSLTVNSETSESVSVGSDNSGLRAKIDDFIAKFNAVQTFVTTATKITTSGKGEVSTSILSGNREVGEVASSLRRFTFDSVPGMSGAIQRLESLGIDFKPGSSQLEVKDSAALDSALSSNAADVKKLFTDNSNGLVSRLDAYLTQTVGSTGIIATQTKNLSKQSSDIDTQITAMERRIASEQALLEQSFVRMEQAQSALQSQLASLTNAFGNSSGK